MSDVTTETATPNRGWRAFFPPAQWLREYRLPWLRYDVVGGVTLAAYAIPVSLAYATLAGLPPQYGIYCYLVAGPAYALFGSSRQLAIGPTSAISLLVGSTLVGMAEGDPQRWAAIAALTALVFAGMSVLAWLLKLSSLVSFISETILTGFKAGAALTIAMTQLPKLFGVKGGGESFFERAWILGGQIPDTNLAVLAFGLAAIALLVAGEKLLPGRPVALVVVAASIVALSMTPLAQMGFKLVGALPPGLPEFALPSLRVRDVDGVIPLAFACFLLAYIEGVSAARALAQRHGDEIDARQELLALGAANLAAGLGQGYPVAGGLSQSTVNDKAGTKTPLALIVASITIGVCLVFLTGLLANLPNVVLAAIVLVAVKGLINIPELRRIWKLSRMEFWVAMAAFAGVLLLGILKGVLLAALISMLFLIHRVAHPHVARLGRVPGTDRFSDLERNPDNELVPGVLVVRVESSILYFNATQVRDRVRGLIASAGDALRLVVWDLSSSPYVDIAGARMLGEVQHELIEHRAKLRLVDARSAVRDLVRAEIGTSVGEVTRRLSVADAIREEAPKA
ncbi:MAG TPA: SulP family inorganic anion transporter [Casimicrobiaceae bacterium]|jgi:high affinity sulfate transporter 1|nr:SulP family inorganic anion transporter [Casimicrobiaceae bacterium]